MARPSRGRPWSHVLRAVAGVLGAALLAVLASAPALAQEDEDCLACHGEPDLVAKRRGAERSVFVDAAAVRASVHARVPCVGCHEDLADAERFPHADRLAPVDCATCHEKEGTAHAASLHGQAHARGDPMAPTCAECHGAHDVRGRRDPAARTHHMNVPALCGRCHHEGSPVSRTHDIPQDRILENYSEGMHGEGLFKKGLSVTAVCTSCHTAHDVLPHTDPRSSIARENVAQTCRQCHTRIEEVHRKVIEGRLWQEEPHKIPPCVDCHQPHKVRRVFYPAGVANRDCLTCHGKPDLATVRDGRPVSLFVAEGRYAAGAHGAVGCAQCHVEIDPSHPRPCDTVRTPVDCSPCHAAAVADYRTSVHGTLRSRGDPDAPVCRDCHDVHATERRTERPSPTFSRNVPALCGRCHSEGGRADVRRSAVAVAASGGRDVVRSYEESIHGFGLVESGLLVTATCVSCHTAHRELPAGDPASSVHPSRIADTCGACHAGVKEQLAQSVHSPSVTSTAAELPTCDDCHGSHRISRTDLANFRRRVTDQCGRCHEPQLATFFDTFHGKVSRLGSSGAAKCHDCHGMHAILPPEDGRSTLSASNVVATCAQCHHGAHESFTTYWTHATHHDAERYPWLHGAFVAMTGLLGGTMAVALLHSALWCWRLWRTRAEWRPVRAAARAAAAAPGARLYLRFDPVRRTQHLLMVVSFLTLALTGMALKFSYAPWAAETAQALGGHAAMRVLHRVAAILLGGVFVAHLVTVDRERRAAGRTWRQTLLGPESLLFRRIDRQEFVATLRWFVGRGPRPRYGRWTYWEKFDYLAVFWGVFVIGLSGLLLWFPVAATHVVPGWFLNLATLIHGDEALLAVAFIFTIHFFNTQLRPDKFPSDPVMFTGRMTLEELRHERPREYDELVASGRLEERLVPPFPKGPERLLRAFGFVALAMGLTLVVLITYAVLAGPV